VLDSQHRPTSILSGLLTVDEENEESISEATGDFLWSGSVSKYPSML